MSKRFTDPEKWSDPWFADLSLEMKALWLFLTDNCNHAGIWKSNKRLAEFKIGVAIDWQKSREIMDGRVFSIGEYWFLPKFLTFHYGKDLRYGDAIRSAVKLIDQYGFTPIAVKSLGVPYQRVYRESMEGLPTLQSKSKSMSKSTPEESVRETSRFVKPTPEDVLNYARDLGFDIDGHQFVDFYESKGWVIGKSPMKSWKAAVRTWKRNGTHQESRILNTSKEPSWMKQ